MTMQVLNVGTDRVQVSEERVVIDATEAMDWPVREFCRVPIFFRDAKYYVRTQTEAAAPYVRRYELWPWPAQLHEAAPRHVVYDEAYVTQRNAAAAVGRRNDRIHRALVPLYPLLGLCWSRFKNRVLTPLGFEPRSITAASVMLIFSLMIVEGIFVGWLNGGLLLWLAGRDVARGVERVFFLTLVLDCVFRFDRLLKSDTLDHPGFGEWLWPGWWRRSGRSCDPS